ncbi:MAG: hypothetical protein ACR2PO_07995 [Methyloligellaceae bacterium]
MRRTLHIAVGAVLFWAVGSGSAIAFQEVPTPSTPSLSGPQFNGRALSFDAKVPDGGGKAAEEKSGAREKKGKGSVGFLPKMNFGLELLYGSSDLDESSAPSITDPATDDLQILGKIKRRF